MTAHRDIFARLVRSAMGPVRLCCPSTMPCGELVARMAETEVDCAVITGADGTIAGLVTDNDVTRRIAFKVPAETPVAEVMTRPVFTVAAADYLYRAVALMQRRRLHRLPVVDEAGRPIGILDQREALAVTSERLIRQAKLLTPDGSADGMRAVKQAQAELAHELLEDNLPALEVQAILNEINNDIYRAVARAAKEAMVEDGWGEPPVECGIIVMGSGGRGESFLRPDQDNGFILADYPDRNHNAINTYFMEFAGRLTRDLDAVGFPYCNGNVMATNPLWRKTLTQWKEHVSLWGRRRSGVAMLHADIFFDFRVIDGPRAFETSLRRHAIGMARTKPRFLHAMATNESHHMVGLGWFDRLVTDDSEGPHQGHVNLKRNGTLPIVEAVRLYALREGIEDTATLARLDRLTEMGVFGRDQHDYWKAAFVHLTTLLLRQQVADVRAGRTPGNYLDPASLSARQRRELISHLKRVEELSARARADFTGEIL